MTGQFFSKVDDQPLNLRFWSTFSILGALAILDFADFFVIGFILAVVGPSWKLTYGEAAMILYGGGVGSIVAAILWGYLSDRWGRKIPIVSGAFICSIAAGLIGLLPDGNWQGLVFLRIMVGFGLAAAATPSLALIVEMTPTQHRTLLTSLFMTFSSLGIIIASISAAALLERYGWRNLAFFGFAPLLPALLVLLFVQESDRWLEVVKRPRALSIDRVGPHGVFGARSVNPSQFRILELYVKPKLFWQTLVLNACSLTVVFGYYLWGPNILVETLGALPTEAGRYFVIISLSALAGRIVISIVAPFFGRRWLGVGCALASASFLAAIAAAELLYFPVRDIIIVLFSVSAFFCEGGLANAAPYTIEQYGTRMGARAAGLAQVGAGIGRIAGPLALAVLAGTTNLVAPELTRGAVAPTFIFFSGCMIAVALAFVYLGQETNGRPMD